jgi:hypothetical protein
MSSHVLTQYYYFIGLTLFMVACYLGGVVVSVLATGPKVRGFKPDKTVDF